MLNSFSISASQFINMLRQVSLSVNEFTLMLTSVSISLKSVHQYADPGQHIGELTDLSSE